jgi:hypothetical protein
VKANSWGKKRTDGAAAALAAFALACGKATTPLPGAAPDSWGPGLGVAGVHERVDFAFDSLDDRPVSTEATRGKPTVLTFVTTSSLPAQAQVDFLVAMSKHDGDRVNYAVVALERRDDRELVELYRKALSIPFPVAMADVQTMAGSGAFGDVSAVPVTVMLDRLGRLVWRLDGRVAKSDELRAAMRGL